MHHEHEYNAIRNSAALIDISPLFKYRITGKDASKFVNRVITRDIKKVAVDQVIYCCWCDPEGKVIDDGTITRLGENDYRWTAADPSLRWFQQNALGLEVQIADLSEQLAALAIQGPTSGRLLQGVTNADVTNLKYFRVTRGKIAGVPVDISRTGYTGDLGFELWIPWGKAVAVWDALVKNGKAFDVHPAGMMALDVARIEAGLILIEVDYTSSKKAVIESQKFSPSEIGLGKLVDLKKDNFVGREALLREAKKGPERALVGLEISWNEVEALYDKMDMAPQVPSMASRVAVPVYRGGKHIGKATSTTWSPTLKKMIALACINRQSAVLDNTLQVEMTVEAVRHTVSAKVVSMPFFNPARKTAVPAT
jgi:aminomethyltransferase